ARADSVAGRLFHRRFSERGVAQRTASVPLRPWRQLRRGGFGRDAEGPHVRGWVPATARAPGQVVPRPRPSGRFQANSGRRPGRLSAPLLRNVGRRGREHI
ncbi:MAG: hypothetical protein AVDCRST_MAG86-3399, partial [uncultured Truepera sp.]